VVFPVELLILVFNLTDLLPGSYTDGGTFADTKATTGGYLIMARTVLLPAQRYQVQINAVSY